MCGAREFWGTLAGLLEAGEKVFLALVAANTRHSPGTAGARLLLSETGQRAGTIGGGIMEHKLLERAAEILCSGDFTPEIQNLDHRMAARGGDPSGMICAGSQTNLYALCRPEAELRAVRRVASLVAEGQSGTLSIGPWGMAAEAGDPDLSRSAIDFRSDGGDWSYKEQLLNRKRLAILGGGHCAQALVHTMSRLGYDVSVFETRRSVVGAELERDARSVRMVDDFRRVSPLIAYPELTWVVVMTTDLANDVRALSGVVERPFRFIGVMGARAKIDEIAKRLEQAGHSRAEIERIHAPVGLTIPSHTPEEIAISVAAQILNLR